MSGIASGVLFLSLPSIISTPSTIALYIALSLQNFSVVSNNHSKSTSVEFKLYKNSKFNLSYKDLEKLDKSKLTISKLREEIIKIRSSKLPDPSSKGNAGSFFKNPEIDELKLNELISNNVDFKYFEIPGNMYKIPAAWLIEKAGWKGYNDGIVGVYEEHALVLINHSSKSGKNIKKLSKSIKEDVFKKFGIMLNEEVNIV